MQASDPWGKLEMQPLSDSIRQEPSSGAAVPLCVDLDCTLLETDTLLESIFQLAKESPAALLRLPFWILQGPAACKREIAKRVELAFETLPVNPALLEFLKEEQSAGRRIVLLTAADQKIALGAAQHLGLFSEVHASDGKRNLKGRRKREFLDSRYGSYAYAGDSAADVPVWEGAEEVIVVSDSPRIRKKAQATGKPLRSFPTGRNWLKSFPRAIRMHQWVKNLLLFVPLVMAHHITDWAALWRAFASFWAFSLCASAVYLINDSLDLEADRRHPGKRHRALASGAMPLLAVPLMVPLLLLSSLAIGLALPADLELFLAGYFLLTLAYSLYLKRLLLVDVLVLASLYTIRVMAGGAAAQVPVSRWLLAFSMFLFLSLAAVKRYSELQGMSRRREAQNRGRGYLAGDLDFVGLLGMASSFSAVLVLALYASSGDVEALYSRPDFLWLVGPIFLYWISRVWLLAFRGQMPEDPVIFAIKDGASYWCGALCAAAFLLAI